MKKWFLMSINTALFVYLIETKKPNSKRLQATWRLECELGIITDPDCPIDGGWSPWAPWSACRGTCDDIGHRKRNRECVNPPASQDGLPCSGLDEQIEPCYRTDCSVKDYRKLIEGDSARIEALRQLEAVPALMERCLRMECPFEAIEAALATDNTWQLNSEVLWNALQCVKHDIGCPVTGEWGVWGTWSSCGARCGKGLRWQLRRCDTPPPSISQLVCSGTPLHYEECEGDQCAIDGRYKKDDMSGTWSGWGPWSVCSEKCGAGVRRRKRTCIEKQTLPASVPWGTHCRGQYDQLEVCNNKKCLLNGGWSGWGTWGPCSQTCGAGKRSRTRSCTRPIPSGGGLKCMGPKVEVGSCHLTPCEVYSHVVALFNGDSFLQYNFPRKRSTFFHFFVRFMSLSPRGTLVRRGSVQNPQVRLSLHKWHICLDASGASKACNLPRICSPIAIEPAIWHSILLTVTNEAATLRLNDAQVPVHASFPCDPELKDDVMDIVVGHRFHGEIQELVLNFIPLNMFIEHERRTSQSDFVPSSASNMAYEKGNVEEAFLTLENDQYLALPCFENQDEWTLELTIKSRSDGGTILVLLGESDYWFYMVLQNMRLKIKVALKDFKSEVSSSTEHLPGQWLDITLSKKKTTNAIEAVINAGERLHVMLPEASKRRRRDSSKKKYPCFNQNNSLHLKSGKHREPNLSKKLFEKAICNFELFVGGVPQEVKSIISEDFTAFSGIIASLNINNVLYDLHDYAVERDKDSKVQVSSRSASISGSYHETAWGDSNKLNLTCLHARTRKSPHKAQWLFLDTIFDGKLNQKAVRSIDDGRVLRLVVTADNDLRGFYTCRAYDNNKRKRNIVSYGVLGKVQYRFTSPDTTTVIAVFTTLSLVIFTIGWLLVEGYYDVRDGYGFFRDIHITPDDESKKDCKHVIHDLNMHSAHNCESITKELKPKPSHKEKCFVNDTNYVSHEFRLMDTVKEVSGTLEDYYTSSEPEGLPALPGAKESDIEPSHKIYRCEPSYVSSPRHGSNITSPGTKMTSSSSLDTSPRVLCSRLLMSKYKHSSGESLSIKKKAHRVGNNDYRNRSNLLTIKSSTFVNSSPAQKILQKFKELKKDDSEIK